MHILTLKVVVYSDNSRALLALLDVFDRAESTGGIKHKPTDVNPNFTSNTHVVSNVGLAGLPSCGSADCLLWAPVRVRVALEASKMTTTGKVNEVFRILNNGHFPDRHFTETAFLSILHATTTANLPANLPAADASGKGGDHTRYDASTWYNA